MQYQVEGVRLLISANGVVEMTPGTFVHLPVGVAFASIVSGTSTHVTTLSAARWRVSTTAPPTVLRGRLRKSMPYREQHTSAPAGV